MDGEGILEDIATSMSLKLTLLYCRLGMVQNICLDYEGIGIESSPEKEHCTVQTSLRICFHFY